MVNTNNKNMNFFIDWLNKNGAEFPNLHIINQKKNERGVKTNSKIHKNKIVIKIPKKLLIYSEMGKQTQMGKQLLKYKNRKLISPDIIYILIYMINKIENKKDFHYPYYKILPRNVKHFPLFWEKNDLKYLENSHLLDEIQKRKNNFKYDYDTLCLAIDNFKTTYSFKYFMWLRTIIGSRNFGVVINGKKQAALVPLSDMLNHSMKPDVSWGFDSNINSFIMKSNKILSRNQEITDSYGSKCNSKYLLYYGFSIHDDSEKYRNTIFLKISQQISKGRLYSKKLQFIKQTFNCTLNNDFGSNEFSNLLHFLRIANANKDELLYVQKHLNFARNPINKRNEAAVLTHLAYHVNSILKSYPLTLKENKENLKYLKQYSNAAFATKLVVGEKKILQNILQFCKLSLEVLLFQRRFSPRKLKNNMKNYILLLNDLN